MPQPYVVEDDPSHEDVRALEDGLYRYNVEQTGRSDGRSLAIFVRDADGTVMAGLSGWTWGGWLKVNNLWVRQDLRRSGQGREPVFYERLGYKIVAAAEDFPAGHKHYTLVKDL